MALALVLVACVSTSDSSTTSAVAACEDPSADELADESDLEISASPNPAAARDVVELTVSLGGLPNNTVVGVDAEWQCWDGSKWLTTHIVYRGFGDDPGQTIPVNSAFQIQVPSIGLTLDYGYPIVIPQVIPGTYRIRDEVLAEGSEIAGFTVVEVVEEAPA